MNEPTTPADADPPGESLARAQAHVERKHPDLAYAQGHPTFSVDDESVVVSGDEPDAGEADEVATPPTAAAEATQAPPRHAGRQHPWRPGRRRPPPASTPRPPAAGGHGARTL
jgi:hypothetical protein